MYDDEDFLDELPTRSTASQPSAAAEDVDMEKVLDAASQPASVQKLTGGPPRKKKVIRKVRRKVVKRTTPPTEAEEAADAADETTDSLPGDNDAEADSSPQYDPVRDEAEDEAADELPDATEDTRQILPSPTKQSSRVVPRPEPTNDTLPMARPSDNDSGRNIDASWDAFLLNLQQATLVAVYELGINSMTEFATWSKTDLMKPRGRLTEAQANEVESKLRIFGVDLASASRLGSARRDSSQTQLRGLHSPTQNLPPLSENATAQERRLHRMSRNRTTM